MIEKHTEDIDLLIICGDKYKARQLGTATRSTVGVRVRPHSKQFLKGWEGVEGAPNGNVKCEFPAAFTSGPSQDGTDDAESSLYKLKMEDLSSDKGRSESAMSKQMEDLSTDKGRSQSAMSKQMEDLSSDKGRSQSAMSKQMEDLSSDKGRSESAMRKESERNE